MKRLSLAGLVATALSAHAQSPSPSLAFQGLESVVVTATRLAQPMTETLRDVTVIPRERIAEAGPVTLAELLQRHALVELRGTGGAGQPAGLFLRGTNAAQTLVLVDGLRVGSATVGTTSIENIPLDLIERIEVVKGPLSSLYGADAVGGVVHVFTRAGAKPRLFASTAFGNDGEKRAAAGFTAIEGSVTTSVSAGLRKAEPASATNARAFCHDPDRDPYENAFANAQLAWRYWQGESVTVGAFTSRGKARFDGCPDASGRFGEDRNIQTLSGARVSSSLFYAPWWSSRLTVGHGRDELRIEAFEPARFETRQDQAAWIHEFGTRVGTMLLGFETVRQKVLSDTAFTRTKRDTDSVFAGINESWQGQRLEASVRRDD
ncbi:MAG TPA: TonB-dependent receptor plug domain-containing protein, partial [Usitatibacteraceae bacterium]|nr:TonB-dependent receptor plug domain-containing protein [Usitatibacteraceae bacterium]